MAVVVAFVHDVEGWVGAVVGALSLLRKSSVPISPQITRLTGITPEMVEGAVLDLDAVRDLLESADLVIAHNAKFDRSFCERLHDDFVHKARACSVTEVSWADLGYEGAKLGYLQGCRRLPRPARGSGRAPIRRHGAGAWAPDRLLEKIEGAGVGRARALRPERRPQAPRLSLERRR